MAEFFAWACDCYQTPEETAKLLKVEVTDIMSLIDQGKLRAIRIAHSIRIPETELERLPVTCAAGPTATENVPCSPATETLPNNSRWCYTRRGVRFRVSGSVAEGAEIWPGRMPYPTQPEGK